MKIKKLTILFGVLAAILIWSGGELYMYVESLAPKPVSFSLHSFGGKVIPEHQNLRQYPKLNIPFDEALFWGEDATLSYKPGPMLIENFLVIWRPEERTGKLSIEYAKFTGREFLSLAGINTLLWTIGNYHMKDQKLVVSISLGVLPGSLLSLIAVLGAIFGLISIDRFLKEMGFKKKP